MQQLKERLEKDLLEVYCLSFFFPSLSSNSCLHSFLVGTHFFNNLVDQFHHAVSLEY